MIKGLAVLSVALLAAACSESVTDVPFSLASGSDRSIPMEDYRRAAEVVMQVCPGLGRHIADLTPLPIESAEMRITVPFLVSNRPSPQLFRYYAQGHHCFFDVNRAGLASVSVAKRPCMKLCLDSETASPNDGPLLRLTAP